MSLMKMLTSRSHKPSYAFPCQRSNRLTMPRPARIRPELDERPTVKSQSLKAARASNALERPRKPKRLQSIEWLRDTVSSLVALA